MDGSDWVLPFSLCLKPQDCTRNISSPRIFNTRFGLGIGLANPPRHASFARHQADAVGPCCADQLPRVQGVVVYTALRTRHFYGEFLVAVRRSHPKSTIEIRDQVQRSSRCGLRLIIIENPP